MNDRRTSAPTCTLPVLTHAFVRSQDIPDNLRATKDIEAVGDISKFFPVGWKGTVLDILRNKDIYVDDRFWVLTREGVVRPGRSDIDRIALDVVRYTVFPDGLCALDHPTSKATMALFAKCIAHVESGASLNVDDTSAVTAEIENIGYELYDVAFHGYRKDQNLLTARGQLMNAVIELHTLLSSYDTETGSRLWSLSLLHGSIKVAGAHTLLYQLLADDTGSAYHDGGDATSQSSLDIAIACLLAVDDPQFN